MDKLRVLIIDDSVIFRNIVSMAVDSTGLGIAEHSVPNGALALEWLQQRSFDLILLDAVLSGSNKNELICTIRNKYPDLDIIIMGKDDIDSIALTLEALKNGAMDFIVKSADVDLANEKDRLKNHLHVLFAQIMVKKFSVLNGSDRASITDAVVDQSSITSPQNRKTVLPNNKWNGADVIVIASSTGGPAALETVFSQIPASFNKPILVVQHMPAEFTKILAQTLNKKYALPVSEGKEGDPVKGGHALVAPGGWHMKIDAGSNSLGRLRMENTPYVNGVRPSADVLFRSVANVYRGMNILAVILTGMGNDGLIGVSEIKKSCNCYCLTQSERSCVVYGMPRTVYEAGLSDEVADLKDIAGRICQLAQSGGRIA